MDENLLLTLEQSLRQTRKMQSRLITKREENKSKIENLNREDEELGREIESLEKLAKQIENAIYKLLNDLRRNK